MPLEYVKQPYQQLSQNGIALASFVRGNENIDARTVASFGNEWESFAGFSSTEIETIGRDYFHIVPPSLWNKETKALDVGCGSGRWSQYVAPKVGSVDAVDPSVAAFVAAKNCQHLKNVTVTHAGVGDLPFPDQAFDLVFSLGVLHHVPDTEEAIKQCVAKVKPGGWFLVYLYYALDNRGLLFRGLFFAVNLLRRFICSLPEFLKSILCDLLAISLYLPLATLARVVEKFFGKRAAEKLPLNYYRDKTFFVIRNDARDRFGTPLEKRFSRREITTLLSNAGLKDLRFSERQPFWVAIGQRAGE